jgi:hypothetical protein
MVRTKAGSVRRCVCPNLHAVPRDHLHAVPRDHRRWIATLAEAVLEGPQGQPAHAAGAEMVVVHDVFLDEVGLVSMSVPKPSAMFLDLAETHASRAVRLRPKLASQIRPIKYGQPDSSNRRFSNEQLVFDFLQEAMAAVLLTYTALDNAANEAMPGDFSMADAAGNTVERAQIEGHWGITKRLSLVLPATTGKPSIELARPDIWSTLETLKRLRDDLGHVHYDQSYTAPGQDSREGLFSRLFAADLRGLIGAVQETIEHYSPQLLLGGAQ